MGALLGQGCLSTIRKFIKSLCQPNPEWSLVCTQRPTRWAKLVNKLISGPFAFILHGGAIRSEGSLKSGESPADYVFVNHGILLQDLKLADSVKLVQSGIGSILESKLYGQNLGPESSSTIQPIVKSGGPEADNSANNSAKN